MDLKNQDGAAGQDGSDVLRRRERDWTGISQVRFSNARIAVALCWAAVAMAGRSWAVDPRFYAVQVSAQVTAAPAQIRLVWTLDSSATSYSVSRKAPEATVWTELATLAGSATSFLDTNIVAGTAYEYQLSKATQTGYRGYGYIFSGTELPLVEERGKIILLVDSRFVESLAIELARLERDLAGDGWKVVRHSVDALDKVSDVKRLIQSEYNADPGQVRALFLFGHIPVPYSGNLNLDGHSDHQGAWPADAYYGDMDGTWSDLTVRSTSAADSRNWNVPGDGKFDQNEIPSDVELEVGRVDFWNLQNFSNKMPGRSELDLLRQYLNKDHNFRHKRFAVERRGVICDNFGEENGEAFAANGWRNFAPLFGANHVRSAASGTYFSVLSTGSYLWGYACGGGSYQSCDGVGISDDFAMSDPQVVFGMYFGSYFGDWDNPNNFLRASLGSSTTTLAACWAGRPNWFVHRMGLGGTLGESARLTQNSGAIYSPQNWGARGTHVALLGDPTLRLHPVAPPSDLTFSNANNGVAIRWTPSADFVIGYQIYRGNSEAGPFQRLTPQPVVEPEFADAVSPGTYTYMVRAVRLESSASGSYFNGSEGLIGTVTLADAGQVSAMNGRPAEPSGVVAFTKSISEIELVWVADAGSQTEFSIERKSPAAGVYREIAVTKNSTRWMDHGLQPAAEYQYRVSARNAAGDSDYSNEVIGTTATPIAVLAQAVFSGTDAAAQGGWIGQYGNDGYRIAGDGVRDPINASLSWGGATTHLWAPVSTDPRALQQGPPGTMRVASAWYGQTFTLNVSSLDRGQHVVRLYFLDWDAKGRKESVDVMDLASGARLDQQTVSDFQKGIYLSWKIQGKVQFRFNGVAGPNAVVSGVFFDPVETGAPVLSFRKDSGSGLEVHLDGIPGETVRLERSADLLNWEIWRTVSFVDDFLNLEDGDQSGTSRRFYRMSLAW